MIGRIVSFLGRLPGVVWRQTAGRLVARSDDRPERTTAAIQPEEPQGVAGIAFRASLVVLGVALGAYLVYELRLLLVLVFLAILLASGLYGAVRFFERFVPRILAILATYILLIGAFGLALFIIFPPLVRQAVGLADDFPTIVDQLRTGAIDLINGIAGAGRGEEIINSLTSGAGSGLPEIGSLLSVPLTVAGIIA
ncbi:MAG: AI-2E family transporter, partial [Candidatus Limnocylindria bacterium]